MVNKPLISIIFPIKLPDLNFEKTISSIQNQNFLNFELIILKSGEFEYFQEKLIQEINFNYKIFIEEGKGVYSAMNLGIEKSIGEYLYFIGAGDELFDCNSLSKVANILKNENLDILMCNVITNNLVYPGSYFNVEKIYKGFMSCHQGIFMNRKWIIYLKGFDIKYSISADFDLILRALESGAVAVFVNLCVARYLGGGISDKHSSILDRSSSLFRIGKFSNSLRFLIVEILAKFYRKYFKRNNFLLTS